MNFTVVWLPAALIELTAIWIVAADQKAVTAATYRIDRRLADDPLDTGESRDANRRLAFDPPLQVIFRVFAADMRVEVVSVGAFGR